MTKSVQIAQTGNVWQTSALDLTPVLYGYSANELAEKIFERRQHVDVVVVVDDVSGVASRTIHRKLAPDCAQVGISGE